MVGLARRRQLERLRRHIETVEKAAAPETRESAGRTLGPVRFAPGALHEVRAADYRDAPAAQGFALALAACVTAQTQRPLVWIGLAHEAIESGRAYGCGLAAFGLAAPGVMFVSARTVQEALWAAEEAARSPRIGAVLFELMKPHRLVDLTATRRLQLAAESSGATPLLLRGGAPQASAARMRWRVAPLQSAADRRDPKAPGNPCWRIVTERSREGGRGVWDVEWDHERLELSAAPAHRGGHPAALADGPPQTARSAA